MDHGPGPGTDGVPDPVVSTLARSAPTLPLTRLPSGPRPPPPVPHSSPLVCLLGEEDATGRSHTDRWYRGGGGPVGQTVTGGLWTTPNPSRLGEENQCRLLVLFDMGLGEVSSKGREGLGSLRVSEAVSGKEWRVSEV